MAYDRHSQMTPHMRRARAMLADGNWHDREKIILDMGKAIPPGIASRFQERVRLLRRQQRTNHDLPVHRESDERIVQRENNTLITMGRRAIALKALHTGRRIEQERSDSGKVWVRLRAPYGHNEAPAKERQPRRVSGEPRSRTE